MSVAQNPNAALRIALVGNPNCGKTALFNRLTGSRQKVANYAGVTVERKEGQFVSPGGRTVRILDLPGAYSLHSASLDEAITREVCLGQRPGERARTCWCPWWTPPTCACTCASCWNCAAWACRWWWC
jgi:ferrous iron transport protein B